MRILDDQARRARVEWVQRACTLLSECGDTAGSQEITQAIEQYQQGQFVLSVLGKAKRGKSTLINALLGRRDDLIAPVDKLPASSAITHITWAREEAASVSYRDGRSESIPLTRIREFVTEEANPENRKQVDVVHVQCPFEGLQPGVVLVDTPGAASIHEHHDALLHAFIPQSDAVIFLVSARMPLDQDELELLGKVKSLDIKKIFFVINRVDESTEQDIHDAIRHNEQMLAQVGVRPEKGMHRISAKRAYIGDVQGSGLQALADDIRDLLTKQKEQLLASRLADRVMQALQPTAQSLSVELASANRTRAELETEIQRLADAKHQLQTDRQVSEREFLVSWKNAIEGFDVQLPDLKGQVQRQIADEISNTPLTQVSALCKKLPSQIASAFEEIVGPPSYSMERALQEAAEKLQADYPRISMDGSDVTIRTRGDQQAVVASLGGAATTAAGVGFAAAGSSAAASIAAANATALSATTTALSPLGAGISGLLSSFGAPAGLTSWLASTLGGASVAAPTTYITTPLWVALAGPVGWSLAGLGVMVVPLAWRSSKLRAKEQIEQATREQINKLFKNIREERIPALRKMGSVLIEQFHVRLERQLAETEAAMVRVRDDRPSPERLHQLHQRDAKLKTLLDEQPPRTNVV